MGDYGKPNVELRDIFVEHRLKPRFTKSFGSNGTRWYASIALELYDIDCKQNVAEWFYLFACSPEFIKKPLRNVPVDEKYTIIQNELDLNEIRKEAHLRYKNINPQTWDEFYDQMRNYFLNEDD